MKEEEEEEKREDANLPIPTDISHALSLGILYIYCFSFRSFLIVCNIFIFWFSRKCRGFKSSHFDRFLFQTFLMIYAHFVWEFKVFDDISIVFFLFFLLLFFVKFYDGDFLVRPWPTSNIITIIQPKWDVINLVRIAVRLSTVTISSYILLPFQKKKKICLIIHVHSGDDPPTRSIYNRRRFTDVNLLFKNEKFFLLSL